MDIRCLPWQRANPWANKYKHGCCMHSFKNDNITLILSPSSKPFTRTPSLKTNLSCWSQRLGQSVRNKKPFSLHPRETFLYTWNGLHLCQTISNPLMIIFDPFKSFSTKFDHLLARLVKNYWISIYINISKFDNFFLKYLCKVKITCCIHALCTTITTK